jgi:hypothetical protein
MLVLQVAILAFFSVEGNEDLNACLAPDLIEAVLEASDDWGTARYLLFGLAFQETLCKNLEVDSENKGGYFYYEIHPEVEKYLARDAGTAAVAISFAIHHSGFYGFHKDWPWEESYEIIPLLTFHINDKDIHRCFYHRPKHIGLQKWALNNKKICTTGGTNRRFMLYLNYVVDNYPNLVRNGKIIDRLVSDRIRGEKGI